MTAALFPAGAVGVCWGLPDEDRKWLKPGIPHVDGKGSVLHKYKKRTHLHKHTSRTPYHLLTGVP